LDLEGGQEMMTNIPSEEDFARAKRLMAEKFRNLDQVEKNTMTHFSESCALHNVYAFPQKDVDFRVYVFFKKNKDLEAGRSAGILQEITDFVYGEMERAGRGKRGDISVAVEFDSDENVTANFEGDYFMRLR
jgi:hypothetical protein